MVILETKNLATLFKSGNGISDINITLDEGTITGFIGYNGAGKTTFIKSISGEYKIDQGEILYKGNKMNSSDLIDFSFVTDFAYTPQDYSVQQLVYYNAQLHGFKTKEAKIRTKEILELVGLWLHRKKSIKKLSAGMCKKAQLASAIVTNPKILFLDEPTANLDIETRDDFIKIIKKINDRGVTIFLTSHLIDEMASLINHLIILNEGHVVFNSKIDQGFDIKSKYEELGKNKKRLNVDQISEMVG